MNFTHTAKLSGFIIKIDIFNKEFYCTYFEVAAAALWWFSKIELLVLGSKNSTNNNSSFIWFYSNWKGNLTHEVILDSTIRENFGEFWKV